MNSTTAKKEELRFNLFNRHKTGLKQVYSILYAISLIALFPLVIIGYLTFSFLKFFNNAYAYNELENKKNKPEPKI